MNSDIEDDIMDLVMQCTTPPSHSSFSQQKLVSFVTEIHTTSIDFLTPNNAYKKTKRREFKYSFLEEFGWYAHVVKKDESEGARNCGLAGVSTGEDGKSSKDFRPRDYKCDVFQPGDILRLTNGMFTYNHDKYFMLRAGRRGKVQKVGEFTMAFEESPNMRDGTFNTGGFDSFMKRVIMAGCALSDGVVAIMGPQNSVSYQYEACYGSFFPSQMMLSGAVVQGQWFMVCDSGVAVQWVSWIYPTSVTGNETLTARSSLISWKDIGTEGFVSKGAPRFL
ncbi:SOSS complex subunit B [Tanacetum coccineum]